MQRRSRLSLAAACALTAALTAAALTDVGSDVVEQVTMPDEIEAEPAAVGPAITLAFGGDVHFAGALDGVPEQDDSTLGPISEVLSSADLAMVNLETAVTERSRQTRKELEDPGNRFWFRTGSGALDVLDRSGVDVVSMANNHGADYGLAGLRDSLAAAEEAPVGVVGIGRDDRDAYEPFRTSIEGTDISVLAGDASPRESASDIWSARAGSGPGIASARNEHAALLAAAVRQAQAVDDLVVVYLHWGDEGDARSTASQRDLADLLTRAGADIIVGSHAHTPLGAGTNGSAYVSYGLGNFYWYHGRESETGVLKLTVQGDEVIGDEWVPARFRPSGGAPRPLDGDAAEEAVEAWEDLRQDTDLEPGPGPVEESPVQPAQEVADLPGFVSTVRRIDASVRASMSSHDEGVCPVALADLRHVQVSYVGFDGASHRGELVLAAEVADDVVSVFSTLYEQRFPIERMRLVDEYDGDDDASMAANNTSAYNCRTVAGTDRFSNHAFGRAVDINPVQNPYVLGGDVRPPAAEDFVDVARGAGADPEPGVITADGVVRTEFDRIGWAWGGLFTEPDYQHFARD